MLRFYNSKIYLDLELSSNDCGIIFNCSFLDKDKINTFFPNLIIKDKLEVQELIDNNLTVYLTLREFENFIYNWFNYSNIKGFNINNWLISYYQGILDLQLKFQEHRPIDIFFKENLVEELKIRIKELKNSPRFAFPVNLSIIFQEQDLLPEISWVIYDFLQEKRKYFFKDINYKYYKELKANFTFNYNSLKYALDFINYFKAKNTHKYQTFNLSINSLEKINYRSSQTLFYFYSPIPHERVRSNFIFIKQELNSYKQYLNRSFL